MCQQCKHAGLQAEYESILHDNYKVEVPPEIARMKNRTPRQWEIKPAYEHALAGEGFQLEDDSFFGSLFRKITTLPSYVFSLLQSGKEAIAVRMAIQNGMQNENDLTDLLFFNRHPELGGRKLVKGQAGFGVLSNEWLTIRNTIVRPALKPAPKPACKPNSIATPASVTINARPCCMLTSALPGLGSNFVEAGALGKHKGVDEVNGIVYTGRAGFVDLGHLREMCDVTKVVFDQLNGTGGPPSKVRANRGVATLLKCPTDFLEAAKAISYDEGKGHEIVSFSVMSVGGHNSSFSPEDLCSNFLGTVVAERAIKAGGVFNDAVTTEIDKLLAELKAQPLAETLKSFDRIKKKWVDFTSAGSIFNNDYLRRRNFSHVPWKTGHKSDSATPFFIRKTLPDFSSVYTFTYKEGGTTTEKSKWAAELAKIKTKARTMYGSKFNSPT